MANDLSILITAALNEITSVSEINKGIKNLQGQIDKLNLTINIDNAVLNTLRDFSNQMSKIADIAKNTGKVIQESFNPDGSGTRTTYYNGLKGEFSQVEIAAKQAGNTVKSSTEEQIQAVNKLTQSYQELTKATTAYNQQGQATRNTQTYQNGNNTLKVNQTASGINYTESLNPAKDLKDQEDLINQMEQFRLQSIQRVQQAERQWETAQQQAIQKNGDLERQDIAKTEAARQAYSDWWLKALTQQEQLQAKMASQDQQKVIDQQDKLTQSLKKMYDTGVLTEQFFTNFNKAINSTQNLEEIDKLEAGLQRVSQYTKNQSLQQSLLSQSQSLLSSGKNVDTAGIENLVNRINSLNLSEADATRQLSLMQNELKGFSANATTASDEAISFGKAMKDSFAPLSMYFGGFMLFQQAIGQFKAGISTLNDLNKSLTTISMITNQSQAQVAGLTSQYQQFGQQLSVSTTDIAANAAELTRQGLSIDQVNSRLKTITEFSKVAGLSASDAMTYITAASNSMKISAQEASDTFAELGHVSGVNAAYIAAAYQKVGGTAGAIGLDFNKVASWITTEGERSKESADTIGSSIKSIIARIQSLKEKGFDSTDGTSINAVAKALDSVGIALMDDQGQFRNFGNVMDELGAKWSSLDSRHKAYIATTVAGTYQQSRFLDLMQGYSRSVTLYNDALNSAGITQQKFNDWSQGTEAALGRLQNAFQGIWIAAFNSNEIQTALNSLTALANGIQTVVKTFGGLPTIVGTAGLAFMAFNTNIRTSITEFGLFSTSFIRAGDSINISSTWSKVFSTAMLSMQTKARATGAAMEFLGTTIKGIGIFIAEAILPVGALMAATAIVQKLNQNYQQQQQQQAELKNKADQLTQTYSAHKSKIDELVASYTNLSSIRNKTSDQEKQYTDVQNQLAQILPQVKTGEDAKGNAIIASSSAIKEQIGLLQQQISLQNQAKNNDAPQNILNNANAINQKNYMDDSSGGLQQQLEYYQKMDSIDQDLLKNQKERGLSQDEIVKLHQEDTGYLIQQNIIQGEINSKQQENVKYIQSYFSNSKINTDAITQISSALSAISLKGKGIGDIDTMFTGIANSVNKLNNALQNQNSKAISDAVKELEQLGVKASIVTDIENQLQGAIDKSTDSTNSQTDATNSAAQSQADYASAVQDMINTANKSITAEEQIVGTTQSMIDQTKELVAEYQILSNMENLSADQKQLLADAIGKLSVLYPNLAKNGQLNVQAINAQVDADNALLKAVNDVKDGAASAEEEMTMNQMLQTKNRIKSITDEITAEQALMDAIAARATADGGEVTTVQMQMYDNASAKIASLKQQIDSLNASYGNQGTQLQAIQNDTKNANSSTQNSIYVVDKYKNAMDALNASISEYSSFQNKYTKDSQSYRDVLQKEIDLLQQKEKLLTSQSIDLTHQINSGNIAQTGMITTGGSTSTSSKSVSGMHTVSSSIANADLYNQYGAQYGVDPLLLLAIGTQESTNGQASSNVMQVNGMYGKGAAASIDAGAKMIADLLKQTGGNLDKALAAYNMGPGVLDFFAGNGGYSVANMQAFSDMQKSRYGYSIYGDPNYVNHVERYYNPTGGSNSSSPSSSGQSASDTAAQKAQAVDQAKSNLLSLTQDLVNTRNQIEQLQAEIEQSKIDAVTNSFGGKISDIEMSMQNSQNSMKNFAEYSSQWRFEMNKQISLQQQKITTNQQEEAALQKLLKTESLTADQRNAINQQLKQLDANTYTYKNDLAALNAQLEQGKIDNITNTYGGQLNDINTQLNQSKATQALYTEGTIQYNYELHRQISLTQQKIAVNEQEDATLKKLLQTDKLTADQRAAIIQQIHQLDADILTYKKDLQDVNTALEQSHFNNYLNTLTKYSDTVNDLNYKLNILKNSLNLVPSGSNSYFINLTQQASTLTQMISQNQAEMKDVFSQMQNFKTPDELKQLKQTWDDLNNAIQSEITSLNDLKNTYSQFITTTLTNEKTANIQHLQDQFTALDDTLSKLVVTNNSFDMGGFTNSIDTIVNSLDELDNKFVNNPLFETDTSIVRNNIQDTKNKIIDLANAVDKLTASTSTSQSGLESLIRAESAQANQLNGQIQDITTQINQTTLAYKEQEDSLQNQITLKQDQLTQMQQQYQLQQNINQLTDLTTQRDQVMADKRFEIIDANGNKQLTYDVAKVADLNKQISDLNSQNAEKAAEQAVQDQIDSMTKNLNATKQIHQAQLDQMNAYKNSLTSLYSQLTSDISNKTNDLKNMQNQQVTDTTNQWDALITAVQNGTETYSGLMNSWYAQTIKDMQSYDSSISSELSNLQTAFNQMQSLTSQISSLSNSVNTSATPTGTPVNTTTKTPKSYTVQVTDPITKKTTSYSVSTPALASAMAYGYQIQKKTVNIVPVYHEGGIIGDQPSSPLSSLVNKLFNTKPNESIVKALKGEIMIPPQNIPNFFKNIGNMVSSLMSPQVVQSGDSIYLSNVTIKTDNAETFLPDLQRIINTRSS